MLKEAFRVLKPRGRIAVSDVVVNGELPDAVRADMEAYVGCIAGALERAIIWLDWPERASRTASIEPTRRYLFADLEGECLLLRFDHRRWLRTRKTSLDGRIMGAFIRAVKPRHPMTSQHAREALRRRVSWNIFHCVRSRRPFSDGAFPWWRGRV